MIYIVGVCHEVQFINETSNLPLIGNFANHIIETIKRNNITILAEEWSEQALKAWGSNTDTLRTIAKKLEIEHIFCDPDDAERKKIGYPTRQDMRKTLNLPSTFNTETDLEEANKKIKEEERKFYPIREKYWLEILGDKIQEDILFVCGDDHIKTFPEQIMKYNVKFSIVSNNVWNSVL